MRIHTKQCEPEELKIFVTKNWLVMTQYQLMKITVYSNNKKIVVEFSIEDKFQIDTIFAFRMCVWLCSYYEYYIKKVRNRIVIIMIFYD